MAIVLVVGLATIVYARASQPSVDASSPQPGIDHWHGAYGFQICTDTPEITLSGGLEDQDSAGQPVYPDFVSTGVHSHDDGVIHWHPYSFRASGARAKLGIFLDNYGVTLTSSKLVLPEGPSSNPLGRLTWNPETARPDSADFPFTYEAGEQKCDGEDATLKVVVWSDYQDPSSQQTYTTGFNDIPFDRNGLVFTIAFVPDDVRVVMPTWASELPALGAVDNASADAPPTGSVPVTDESIPETALTDTASTSAPDTTGG